MFCQRECRAAAFNIKTHPVLLYDALNRLATLTENGRVTTYGYDLNGNQVYQQLPNGEETDTVFDALNRRTAMVTTKVGGGPQSGDG